MVCDTLATLHSANADTVVLVSLNVQNRVISFRKFWYHATIEEEGGVRILPLMKTFTALLKGALDNILKFFFLAKFHLPCKIDG